MARPKRSSSTAPAVSSGQASYILERLIKDRRVSPGDVNRYASEMTDEIEELEQRLQRLREANGGMPGELAAIAAATAARRKATRGRRPGRQPGRPPRSVRPFGPVEGDPPTEPILGDPPTPPPPTGPPKPGRTKRKFTVTPEVLASRQLQGRYLALVRQFPEGKRKKYAKTAKKKGRAAAIKEMTAALKKSL